MPLYTATSAAGIILRKSGGVLVEETQPRPTRTTSSAPRHAPTWPAVATRTGRAVGLAALFYDTALAGLATAKKAGDPDDVVSIPILQRDATVRSAAGSSVSWRRRSDLPGRWWDGGATPKATTLICLRNISGQLTPRWRRQSRHHDASRPVIEPVTRTKRSGQVAHLVEECSKSFPLQAATVNREG